MSTTTTHTRDYPFLVLATLLVLVSGCGRAPSDLVVRVTDENDNALPKAIVFLDERKDMQATDQAGEITWVELEEEVATLIIVAHGYQSRTVEVTLERGHNEEVVALERAILPSGPQSP